MISGLKDSKDEPAILTPWSIIHLISGILFASFTNNIDFKQSFFLFLVMHTTYEIKDIYFEGDQNSIANCIGDELISIVGFLIGWKLDLKKSITLSLLLFILFLSPLFSSDGKWSNGIDIAWSRG